ncbi:MAG TPA: hypothetical protein VF409_00885, partial [Sphingomonas sp.]
MDVADPDARNEAHDQLLYKTMSTIRAQRTKAWKEQEASVRADVTERINARPEFKALHLLRTGKMLDNPEAPVNRVRLDRQWLVDHYGEGVLNQLPNGVPPIYAENGAHPDDVAAAVGFESGDQMVRTLITLNDRKRELLGNEDKRSVRQALIDEETAQEMRDRHGDPLNDGSIEEEALAAVQNDLQGEKMATELRLLGRRSNRTPTPYSLAKDWARGKVADSTVQEATSGAAIQRYSRAAAKAGKAAEAAMMSGDLDEAFRQKQAQMLNNALVSEATKARDEVAKARDRLANYARRRTIKGMDQEYLEQIHDLLEQVEFKPRSQASIDRQTSFEAWAMQRAAEGHDVVVPPSFAASLGLTHWSRLSVDKMLGLTVILRDASSDTMVSSSAYTVSLVDNGGSVTFAVAPASGYSLYIVSNPSFEQTIQFSDGDRWSASPVNEANDRSAVRDLALKGLVDRALVAPVDEDPTEYFGEKFKGDKGDPGGNAMAVGQATLIPTLTIPAGYDLIRTSQFGSTRGKGSAFYRRKSVSEAAPAAWGSGIWWHTSADGAIWLLNEREPDAFMFGAVADGART